MENEMINKRIRTLIERFITRLYVDLTDEFDLNEWIEETGVDFDYFIHFDEYDKGVNALTDAILHSVVDLLKFKSSWAK